MVESVKPGWYEHPQMVNTLCYWDGAEWTDRVQPKGEDTSNAVAAGGFRVLVVLALVAVVLVVGYLIFTAYNDLDCASRNVDRAANGQPTEDCD